MKKVSKQPVFKDGARVSVNATGEVGRVVATVSRVNGYWLRVEFKLAKGTITTKYIRPGAVTKVR